MAGSYNIVAEQGATWNFNFTVATDDIPWDLTTYTLAMQVRESTVSTTKLLDVETDGTVTMNSVGEVSISVPWTKMATIPAGRWVYDLELTSSGGEVTRLLEGRFIVDPEVTV